MKRVEGMAKVFAHLSVYHVAAFVLLWLFYPEISVLPLGGLVGLSMCNILFIIDRRGLHEVDTLNLIRTNATLYIVHLGIYAGLLCVGYILAWIALR